MKKSFKGIMLSLMALVITLVCIGSNSTWFGNKQMSGMASLEEWYEEYRVNGADSSILRDIDGIVRDDSVTKKFGGRIWFAKSRSGTHVILNGVSIGYRAWRNNNGKRENGFVTCGHALKDSPEKAIYADSLGRTRIGTIRETVYSGNCDAAFVVLLNGASVSGKIVYGNTIIDISPETTYVTVGEKVSMIGATSGYVANVKIKNLNATMYVKGRDGKNFVGLMLTDRMSQMGDSGAPVFRWVGGKYKIVGIVKGHDGNGTYVVRESAIAAKLGAHPY